MYKLRSKAENIERTKEIYKNAGRTCDIVMKGGIASGVVYPPALCELAKTYRYMSIGGTSVGAIAASATAAAEYGRDRGGTSFAEFEELPTWFGLEPKNDGNTNLFQLFQPQRQTKKIFDIIFAVLNHSDSSTSLISKIVLQCIKAFPIYVVLGALPGFLLLISMLYQGNIVSGGYGALVALFLIVFGSLAFAAFALYSTASTSIPENFYGMCTGLTEGNEHGPQGLTSWLSDLIDRLAGLEDKDKPLTFGDLDDANIELMTMTTSLTHSRPYNIPFDTNIFYFSPDEFRHLFPEKVVRWMVNNPRKSNTIDSGNENNNSYINDFKKMGLLPMPDQKDLPVIIAARLSMSYPILLSAIPLWAIDYTRKKKNRKPERCWFSDGGICSNFPIHYFDKPLPNRPTFAINLNEFPIDYPKHPTDESKNVWMPRNNSAGILPLWHRFDNSKANTVLSFLSAIMNSMMNWLDTTQTTVPGYRDRIAHVRVGSKEGGLNLNMHGDVIESLGKRGDFAAKKLIETYTKPPNNQRKLSWDNHRWTRLRSTLPLIVKSIKSINKGYSGSNEELSSNYKRYEELIKDPPGGSYKWISKKQCKLGFRVFETVKKNEEQWDKIQTTPEDYLSKNAPNPEPEVRIMSKI